MQGRCSSALQFARSSFFACENGAVTTRSITQVVLSSQRFSSNQKGITDSFVQPAWRSTPRERSKSCLAARDIASARKDRSKLSRALASPSGRSPGPPPVFPGPPALLQEQDASIRLGMQDSFAVQLFAHPLEPAPVQESKYLQTKGGVWSRTCIFL